MRSQASSENRDLATHSSPQASGRPATKPGGGLAGWLLQRLGANSRPKPKLALLERITLAPRQTLSLVEADGRRLLIATSAEGAAAFYPLDSRSPQPRIARPFESKPRIARTSW